LAYQAPELFSQNKYATNNQPANSTFLSEQTSKAATSHQLNEQALIIFKLITCHTSI
jgi:hypothetical protein